MSFKGIEAHLDRLRRLQGPEATRLVGQALFAGGQKVQVEAQLSLTRGAVSGKNHVASDAPAPPNQDTDVLGSNIETVLVSPHDVEVSSNAPYAAAQEFGYAGNNLPERPYMRPARDKMQPEIKKLVNRAIDRVVKKSRSTRKG
jgi:hypothetical protein